MQEACMVLQMEEIDFTAVDHKAMDLTLHLADFLEWQPGLDRHTLHTLLLAGGVEVGQRLESASTQLTGLGSGCIGCILTIQSTAPGRMTLSRSLRLRGLRNLRVGRLVWLNP